ncbi:MAG TPA: thioredoxin, partial [Candidatus Aminicenantes bacterium]|nr:thioredoxin [Candidatus Aminicenantes bacterium]
MNSRRLNLWALSLVVGLAAALIGAEPQAAPVTASPLVTFVELGSVKCIPCKMMQPVMKAIEQEYA